MIDSPIELPYPELLRYRYYLCGDTCFVKLINFSFSFLSFHTYLLITLFVYPNYTTKI